MMLDLILLYVGGTLFINGLTLLGKISPRESAVMNLLTGGLSLYLCVFGIDGAEPATMKAAAFGLLFSFTYL